MSIRYFNRYLNTTLWNMYKRRKNFNIRFWNACTSFYYKWFQVFKTCFMQHRKYILNTQITLQNFNVFLSIVPFILILNKRTMTMFNKAFYADSGCRRGGNKLRKIPIQVFEEKKNTIMSGCVWSETWDDLFYQNMNSLYRHMLAP